MKGVPQLEEEKRLKEWREEKTTEQRSAFQISLR